MSARRLSDRDHEEILRLYRRGVKTRTIAEQFGVAQSYPGRLALRRGGGLRLSAAARAHMATAARSRGGAPC